MAADAPLLAADSYIKIKFNIDSANFIGAVQCLIVSDFKWLQGSTNT